MRANMTMRFCQQSVMMVLGFLAAVISGVPAGASSSGAAAPSPPSQPWFPQAPPLPAPAGVVIRVATRAALGDACVRAPAGATILVADGLYPLGGRRLEIGAENVTLRGESGRRERVVIEGGGIGEALAISASGVTVADLTVQNVRWNGIKLNTDRGIHRIILRNCVLHNIWQRGVKGVTVPADRLEEMAPTGIRIEYCLFYNDRAKRTSDDPGDAEPMGQASARASGTARAPDFRDNYIGGIDAMAARDWAIRDNIFIGIQGKTREGRGAVFLWRNSRDCVIERNVIIDCDQGICLGNAMRHDDTLIHCEGFIVRNNFIIRCPEGGIFSAWTRDCRIFHNTVHEPQSRLRRYLRVIGEADGLVVANNLLGGEPQTTQATGRIEMRNNLGGDFTAALVDPAVGNLRLTFAATGVIDQAIAVPEVTEDIDGRPRGARPDIGAHEWSAAP